VRLALLEPAGAPPIWFAREDTLHSAEYILAQEAPNVQWWTQRAARAAASPGGCRAADVGSNGGFFALTARALGCAVLAVDAQPRCLQRLASSAAVNGFASGVATMRRPWGPRARRHHGGGHAVQRPVGREDSEWIDSESERNATVAVRPLTDALAGAGWMAGDAMLQLLEIDAEGSEVAVLRSAAAAAAGAPYHRALLQRWCPGASLRTLRRTATWPTPSPQCTPLGTSAAWSTKTRPLIWPAC
jgi:FkbM family methyltransferase